MFNKKRLTMLVLCIILLFSGCANTANNATTPDDDTLVITDSIGREVTIQRENNRIACLYAFTGHAVSLLGENDKIVAVVNGLKRDKLFVELFPNILDTLVPYTSGSINVEELIKTDPDVVLVQYSTANNESEMGKLDKLGLKAVCIDFNSIEEQMEAVEIVGKVAGVNAEKMAAEYINYFNRVISLATERTKSLEDDEKIRVYHSIKEAVRTDSEYSLGADWTNVAGITNVSINKELELVDNNNYASLEQIFLWNPEVIIVNEDGVADYILEDPKWQGLDAVNNKTVYQMPVGISRWGHSGSIETPLAILWLDKLLYPDLFEDVDLYEETKYFYETFFQLDLSDKDIENILSGKGMREKK